MPKVMGLGGVFIKAENPEQLASWYQKYLGIDFNNTTYSVLHWSEDTAPASQKYSVFTFFKKSTEYFKPSEKECMINLRVDNLAGLLENLRSEGVTVLDHTEQGDYGNFGWIIDPEGNKLELWEPPVSNSTE